MKIKQVPEDFVVEEINSLKASPNGKYCIFLLQKKGWNTIDAVREIASRLNMNEKDIRYAGLKDKEAVTKQIITVDIKKHVLVQRLKIKDITLEFLGMSERHTQTTDNEGNKFTIALRDIDKKYKIPARIPNYYDEQRFGNNANNHDVGRLIIRKKFKEACEILNLEVQNNDYIGALKKTGLMHIYFSAYQSYLFNSVLSSLITQSCKKVYYQEISGMTLAFPKDVGCQEHVPDKLPVVAFDTEFVSEKVKEEYETLLKKDDVTLRDFAIKQFPNLVASSPERDTLIEPKDFKVVSYVMDELNYGKMKETIKFTLPRGSYATMVIKSIL